MSLYETLKAAKIGAAPDVLTKLRAQIAPFAKGGSTPAVEKELEDVSPLSFSANGEPLIDWSIDGVSGGVGDRTANLSNVTSFALTSDRFYQLDLTVPIPAGTYSISANLTHESGVTSVRISFRKSDASQEVAINMPINENGRSYATVTLTNDCYSIYFYGSETAFDVVPIKYDNLMINSGSTALDFEPYGYKIPVTCGGETNTIYLDAQLGASDSISMADTGITIPTVDGSNTLSVGTTVQPSKVYIKYKE
jgi:hypothetical protein